MLELILGNSYSQVVGLTTENYVKLRKLLSYSPNPSASYYSGGFSYRKYLIDKKGFFPTGLAYIVRKFIFDLNPSSIVTDKRNKPKPGKLPIKLVKLITPYPWQLKALEEIKLNSRGGIVAPTGSGKSLAMALVIDHFKLKTLVVVPTVEIREQLRSEFTRLFGSLKNILVENIDSSKLSTCKDCDLILVDECHRSAASTYQKLNKTAWKDIYYRFFFSATYFRNQDNEHLLFESIAGKPIFELGYKEAVKMGYIVPIEAYYVEVPKTVVNGYTWREVYSELVVNNSVRNEIIGKLLQIDANILCLVKEIAHGSILNVLHGVHFSNGQDQDSRQYIQEFSSGRLKRLIGTTGVLSEGVDTKPCEYVIYAGLGKAKSAFMQAIGRAVRRYEGKESAKIIIFRDPSHKWTKAHFATQKKILLEAYGVNLLKLDI